mmetsp:Transcript_41601/g.134450  ORF Transcript_41601/g.134450 Transcript_41601/m.134450 type:complete len:211 (+) Transcript_41601:4430-5062(+)
MVVASHRELLHRRLGGVVEGPVEDHLLAGVVLVGLAQLHVDEAVVAVGHHAAVHEQGIESVLVEARVRLDIDQPVVGDVGPIDDDTLLGPRVQAHAVDPGRVVRHGRGQCADFHVGVVEARGHEGVLAGHLRNHKVVEVVERVQSRHELSTHVPRARHVREVELDRGADHRDVVLDAGVHFENHQRGDEGLASCHVAPIRRRVPDDAGLV